MEQHLQRAEKVLARINELALLSQENGGITRTYGTPVFIESCKKIRHWFNEAGLQTSIDNIGNVRGRLLCANADAKTLCIASHIDSVVNAGMFDGPLGIIMGLDLVEQLVKTEVQLPFNIELISFCDEEGVRFHTTYLGSKAVAGTFDSKLLDKTDDEGLTLREVIQSIGGNPEALHDDAIPANNWLSYFEIHIEQGPVLYENGNPVAVVTAIAGQKRAVLMFTGLGGHAGTVPMNMRNDALCCAAECILAIEQYATKTKNIVATVGKLDVINEASNVIPESVICSLDMRSADEETLSEAWHSITGICNKISLKRNNILQVNLIQETKPISCDYHSSYLLKDAVKKAGYDVIELISGAGHDAVAVSEVAPVAMMFVRCFKGISHNPLEDVEIKDIAAAIKVAEGFIKSLINYYNQE